METSSVITQIGNTPLVRLKQASELTGCNIYGKAEYFNPGESVKDRAALFIVQDAIKRINYKNFKYVCCIYPCNPLLFKSDLKNIFSKIKKNNKKFIFPVCEYSHPIERAFTLDKKKRIIFLNKKNANLNTESFKKKYHDVGQFYWGSKECWLNSNSLHNNSIGYEIPRYRSVDIDDHQDWDLAKILFRGIYY